MNPNKRIYYAHHLYKYNSEVENYEMKLIQKVLPNYEILNPNGDIIHEDLSNEEQIMKKCLSEISRFDVVGVVFSSMSGVVGKGVFDEVNHARVAGKKVYYIHNNALIECSNIMFTIINESRRLYALVSKFN